MPCDAACADGALLDSQIFSTFLGWIPAPREYILSIGRAWSNAVHQQNQKDAGARLVVHCIDKKASEVELDFAFAPQRWYHIALSHSAGGRLTASSVRLFVDGRPVVSARFKFPKVGRSCRICVANL